MNSVPQMQICNRTHACGKSVFEKWNSLNNFHELRGEIKIVTTAPQPFSIFLIENAGITTSLRPSLARASQPSRRAKGGSPTYEMSDQLVEFAQHKVSY